MDKKKGYEELFELAGRNYNEAKKISLQIPADKLDYQTLLSFQKSGDPDVRNLAAELLLTHFPDRKLESAESRILGYF
ncbi:MAG: hypothetical protein ABIG87_00175 [Patescibacteria group bacterium]